MKVNVFDFNWSSFIGHSTSDLIPDKKGVVNTHRTNHFLLIDGLSSETRLHTESLFAHSCYSPIQLAALS